VPSVGHMGYKVQGEIFSLPRFVFYRSRTTTGRLWS
jgi:hypothetical protein